MVEISPRVIGFPLRVITYPVRFCLQDRDQSELFSICGVPNFPLGSLTQNAVRNKL
jgi:hypothetical protein